MNKDNFVAKATSSQFLQARIKLNQNATNNFEHWSINTMPQIPLNSNILDLGCGTGKQIESFSHLLPKTCLYVGCDISKESIELIKQNYSGLPQLKLINESFDKLESFFEDTMKFDLIYSFYALYYTENLKLLIENIYKKLNDGGVFWVVMPYKNTNIELFSILEKIYPIDKKVTYSINQFSSDIISNASEVKFSDIDVSLFENKIKFESSADLLTYLKNTTFYKKEFEEKIVQEIENSFTHEFLLTKEVISIKLTK